MQDTDDSIPDILTINGERYIRESMQKLKRPKPGSLWKNKEDGVVLMITVHLGLENVPMATDLSGNLQGFTHAIKDYTVFYEEHEAIQMFGIGSKNP